MPEATVHVPRSIQLDELRAMLGEAGYDEFGPGFEVWATIHDRQREALCEAMRRHGFNPDETSGFVVHSNELELHMFAVPRRFIKDTREVAKLIVHVPIIVDSAPNVEFRIERNF